MPNPNSMEVGALIPGPVVAAAVTVSQRVEAGAILLSFEAMKTETHMTADRADMVERLLVKLDDRVQAKDLLIVLRHP